VDWQIRPSKQRRDVYRNTSREVREPAVKKSRYCFIFTVPNKTGAGVQQQYVLTLDGAKIVNYSVDTETDEEEGSVPTEEVVFTSESIVSAFYPTSIDGTFGDPSPDMVSFNYETSELESGTAI